jgi:hypothetical protein
MSDSTEPDSIKWFRKNYPVEELLCKKISEHVDTSI